MMEELRTEMKQMLLTVMEANHHPPVVRQRLKSAEMKEQVKTVYTASSVDKRATSPVDAEHSDSCRETGQDYRGGTTSSPGFRVPKPAEICQLDIASDNAQRHSSGSEHSPVPALQTPITAGRTGWEMVYCQLLYGQPASENTVGHRCSVLHC